MKKIVILLALCCSSSLFAPNFSPDFDQTQRAADGKLSIKLSAPRLQCGVVGFQFKLDQQAFTDAINSATQTAQTGAFGILYRNNPPQFVFDGFYLQVRRWYAPYYKGYTINKPDIQDPTYGNLTGPYLVNAYLEQLYDWAGDLNNDDHYKIGCFIKLKAQNLSTIVQVDCDKVINLFPKGADSCGGLFGSTKYYPLYMNQMGWSGPINFDRDSLYNPRARY